MFRVAFKGFSLAEILMVVAIMGLLAAFTVPRMIQPSANNAAFNAKANDAAVMIMSAYQTLKAEGNVTTSTKAWDLTPYMNYVQTDTSTPIDDLQTKTTWGCDSTRKCVRLHNGGMVVFSTLTFTGTANTNCIGMQFDPDGKNTDGTTNGPGKSVEFILYYDGVIRTDGTSRTGGTGACSPNNAANDPPWFSFQ
ncbi:MAG TPA: prepilin-type N-terminal cleavage/methylation domain-containing protein [Coleofasciculaceae cyanobacterium]|jgi:prepilin-type N-terminal cleavage/methylation domain-containing protein